MNSKDESLLKKLIQKESFKEYFSEDYDEGLSLLRFDRSQNIIRQSTTPEYLYFMCLGRCRVTAYSQNGKKMVLSVLKAPCLIGEIELISERRALSVDALEDCLMIAIPLQLYRQKLLNDPRFLRRLCLSLSEKEGKAILAYAHNISYPLLNRLARFILDNKEGDLLKVKKVVIAETLGVSYRHLESVINELVERKILEKRKLTYLIKDLKTLEELSQAMDIAI
ncbi:MAG: transcriptional regulator YeiL [Erysipelotrichaceae bacterium]|nr:transcriptional regulator YeiL [Erysipelotrichaceae bacterium]